MKYFIIAFILFFITCSIATAQVNNEPADDMPFMFVLVVVGMGLILSGALAGVIVITCAVLAFFALVSFGIVSTSLAVGLYKNSFTKGFKTFIMLCAAAGGTFIGVTGLWLLNKVYHWFSLTTAITSGLIFGLLSGLVFGYIGLFILRRLTAYFKTKLNFA